jgi:antitoxin (DNA-binding transcriptional repressor) of toxin-antitoxin stability system
MSKTIPVDQLPREAERLLSAAWEEHESVVLERDGEPVAAVVPMEEYRRWHPEAKRVEGSRRKADRKKQEAKTPMPPAAALAYELPADVLEAYHRLVSKKFAEGLTAAEEADLERLGAELDAADAATPLEREADARARREHDRRLSILNDIIAKLKSLQQPE